MMVQRRTWTTVFSVLAVAILASILISPSARADLLFEIDSNPGGTQMYNDIANHNVSSFHGYVGSNSPGTGVPVIDITTIGKVNTGSGFSNITPVNNGTLTSVTFTPENSTLFNAFSFRGQLSAAGTVHLTVTANNGTVEGFDFTGLPKNADFSRLGIIDAPGSTATIKSVTITNSSFKEVKQIEFRDPGLSTSSVTTPEPSTLIVAAFGALGFLGYGLRSRFKKS
jgi:hypothetical protein